MSSRRTPVYIGDTFSSSGTGIYEPVIAAASPDPTLKYWRGDKSWQALNQAAVEGLKTNQSPTLAGLTLSGLSASVPVVTDGASKLASQTYANFKTSLVLTQNDIANLTTGSSPVFVTINPSGLTNGYVPYKTAAGLADSFIKRQAAGISIIEAAGVHGITIILNSAGYNQIFSDYYSGVAGLPLQLGSYADKATMTLFGGNAGFGTPTPTQGKVVLQDDGGSTKLVIRNFLTGDAADQYSAVAGGRTSDGNSYLALGTTTGGVYGEKIIITSASIGTAAATALTLNPTGNLDLTPGGTALVRTTTGVRIQSDNYASQTTGWGISYAGSGDFRYLYADELHAKAFIADLEQALAGGQIICKSVAPLAAAFTVPAEGAAATLVVESFKGFDTFKVFVDGDMIRLRQFDRTGTSLTIANCWGTVAWVSTDTTNKTQTYTFTRSANPNGGTASGTIGQGTLALDYGTTGNGYLESNAIDGAMAEYAPYHQVVSWATHPNGGLTIRTRLGNLKGIFNVADEYGLYAGAGVTDASQYLRISNQAAELHNLNIKMFDGATNTILLSPTAPSFALGNPLPTAFGTGAGIWMGKDTTYKFRAGNPGGYGIFWDGTNLAWSGVNTSLTTGGVFTATLGYIGGWTIGATSLMDAAGAVGMSSAATGADDIRFWAGNATPGSAPFRVTEAGVLTASSGTIGGWTLNTTSFYNSTYAELYASGNNVRLALGNPFPAAYGAAGIWLGTAGAVPKFSIYASATNYMTFDGTNLALVTPYCTINSTGITVKTGTARQQESSYSFSNTYGELNGLVLYRVSGLSEQDLELLNTITDADPYDVATVLLENTVYDGTEFCRSSILMGGQKSGTMNMDFGFAGTLAGTAGHFTFTGGNVSVGGSITLHAAAVGITFENTTYGASGHYQIYEDSAGILGFYNGGGSARFWLTAVGGIYREDNGLHFNQTSDARAKKNIVPYSLGLKELLLLEPKSFEFNGKMGTEDGRKGVGLVAQDVEKIIPQAVTKEMKKMNKDDTEAVETLGLSIGDDIHLMLINAVKELSKRIAKLETSH